MKNAKLRLLAAIALSPAITVAIVVVAPYLIDRLENHPEGAFEAARNTWMLFMFVALPFTLIYGWPISEILWRGGFNGYRHYAIAGFTPALIFVAWSDWANDYEAFSIDSLSWLSGGILTAILFRWFRGSVTHSI